jgi:hypothetical protein
LETCPEYSFCRILGSTGKAGFSILTLPENLMARQLNPGAWRVMPQAFDGSGPGGSGPPSEDCFQRSSLHLSFTDWQAPLVRFQSQGQRDAEINIIEAVVSVRDAGEWVADVDISRALRSKNVVRLPVFDAATKSSGGHGSVSKTSSCGHDEQQRRRGRGSRIHSVETWDQVLDCPDGTSVIRSYENWLARLAIVSVLCQHGADSSLGARKVVICPTETCWACNESRWRDAIFLF